MQHVNVIIEQITRENTTCIGKTCKRLFIVRTRKKGILVHLYARVSVYMCCVEECLVVHLCVWTCNFVCVNMCVSHTSCSWVGTYACVCVCVCVCVTVSHGKPCLRFRLLWRYIRIKYIKTLTVFYKFKNIRWIDRFISSTTIKRVQKLKRSNMVKKGQKGSNLLTPFDPYILI